ncbi:MAG TPA: hypothetical protein VJ806_07330 [Luteimonas sp.]|nr:hypothetical protein [Luteimonas sp.]
MRLFFVVPIAFALLAPHAAAGESKHYVELVNRAKDSVTGVSIAATGTDLYTDLPLHEPLFGGGSATTVQVAGEGCRYDFRFSFRDGRTSVYQGIDVCKASVLRIRAAPAAERTRIASSQGR